jgi:hypothetical protein
MSAGERKDRHPSVLTIPAGVVSGPAGVVFFLRDFVVGQERFQDCDAGLDLRSIESSSATTCLILSSRVRMSCPRRPRRRRAAPTVPRVGGYLVQVGDRLFG